MKKKTKILLSTILCFAIVIIGIIIAHTMANKKYNSNDEEIEQYSYRYLLSRKLFDQKIISTYEEYKNTFEITYDFDSFVGPNFFDENTLIIIKDKGKNPEGIISNLKINNNVADITIKRKYAKDSHSSVAISEKYYAIPVKAKNIKGINIIYKYPSDVLIKTYDVVMHVLDITFLVLPFLLIILSIVSYIKNKKVSNADPAQKRKLVTTLIFRLIGSGLTGVVTYFIRLTTEMNSYKPIIYLYPKKTQEIKVFLGHEDKITVSYPQYKNSWNVLANPNGDLKDLKDNKELYSLYYECHNTFKWQIEKDGFIVKSEDLVYFLEEKLSILGLNNREKEEFIIYWLPVLQKNPYNYIRFALTEEINENMPLNITPKPDITIRIMMTYKGVKKPFAVSPQQLVSPERKGYVVIEWGGTEIK